MSEREEGERGSAKGRDPPRPCQLPRYMHTFVVMWVIAGTQMRGWGGGHEEVWGWRRRGEMEEERRRGVGLESMVSRAFVIAFTGTRKLSNCVRVYMLRGGGREEREREREREQDV